MSLQSHLHLVELKSKLLWLAGPVWQFLLSCLVPWPNLACYLWTTGVIKAWISDQSISNCLQTWKVSFPASLSCLWHVWHNMSMKVWLGKVVNIQLLIEKKHLNTFNIVNKQGSNKNKTLQNPASVAECAAEFWNALLLTTAWDSTYESAQRSSLKQWRSPVLKTV